MLKIVGKFVLGLATPLTATMIGAYLVQQYVPPRVVTVAPPPPPPPSMMMPASELAKFVSPPAAATDPAALVAAPAASRQVTLPARPAAAPRPAREEAPQQHARMMGKIAPPPTLSVEEMPAARLAPAMLSPPAMRPGAATLPPPTILPSATPNDPLSVSADDRARLADVPLTDVSAAPAAIAADHPSLFGRLLDTMTSVLREPR